MSRKSINDGEGGAVIVLWNMGGNVVKRKHFQQHPQRWKLSLIQITSGKAQK